MSNKKIIIWIILAIAGAFTGVLFLFLKITGLLHWPWFYVVLPFIGVVIISIVILVAIAVAWVIANSSKK